MVTIVELRFPASQTLFAEAVERDPSIEMELEQVVQATGLPIRVRGVQKRDVEAALDATARIEGYDLISDDTQEWLYSVRCEEGRPRVLGWIVETGGTVLSATLSGGTWSVRLRYTLHADVERTVELLRENGIEIDIGSIRSVSEEDIPAVGLTPEQYEALSLAVEYGYFEIPRRTSLEELSNHLDISHQSLSERLRRAQKGLLNTNLTRADADSQKAF
ncbi:helix-turn-helix domain-containing protein [Natronorarus salvus]|uniref:helix-turn-helix domain-containing protein n=1 Tax=Natronorarus salvus TaxID=3117733 RepID=UPI002F267481